MKLKLLAAALALCAAPASLDAQPANRPKLVVMISVDQFSADLFAEYRGLFSGGLRRLSQGAVFPAGFQSHANTETCPGHSTILTGSRPARTGIIANDWYDWSGPRPGKIYCSEDESVPGTTADDYRVSDLHLRVPTLGELMRRADPRTRVVSVTGKDRSGVMMSGRNPDQRWFWKDSAYISDRQGGQIPAPVLAANERVAAALSRPREPMALPDVCEGRSRDYAIPNRATPVGSGRFARAAGDRIAFRDSPDHDRETLAIAEGLRDQMRLGEGPQTDLLILGLSSTDRIGHAYGNRGSEMCIQMLALDRLLGAFFQDLDRRGIDYVVALTADHGALDIPERAAATGIPDAARVDFDLNIPRMGAAIGRRLGLPGPALFGDGAANDVWIDSRLPARTRARILAEGVRAYRAHPQVAHVFTREEILAAPLPAGPPDTWSLLQRIRASFDPQRSGDFYVVLKPNITPLSGRTSVATHGSIWDYDRRVPILFWRRGMTGFEQPLAVETVDIMPTLAGLIGLPRAPGSVDGRCLDLIVGPGTNCPN